MIDTLLGRTIVMFVAVLLVVGIIEYMKSPDPVIEMVAIAPVIVYVPTPLVLMSETASYTQAYNVTDEIASKIVYYAQKHSIDVPLAFGLVHVESNFNPYAISHKGARGLTQLMRLTAGEYLPNPVDSLLYDIDTNLNVGMTYLAYLIEYYDGDVTTALVAYNRGPAAVDQIRQAGRTLPMRYPRMVMASARRVAD